MEERISNAYLATKGVIRAISELVIVGIIVFALIGIIGNLLKAGIDDSDKNAWKRSGFIVRTDHKTGIEYLCSPEGGIIKRG